MFASIILFVILVFSSCSHKMGYSVLLWDYPEEKLQDGEIVPVFIRSNISQVYVIEIPHSKERRELPLWQLTTPQSRGKAAKTATHYSGYLHQYAYSRIDGLPIRADASNVARSVYRLRQNEIIKILYEGKGQPVMAGEGMELDGKWLYVLTTDGTRGWCFSYNLVQFETDASGKPIGGDSVIAQADDDDNVFGNVVSKTWYPSKFRSLINDGTVDLTVINPSYHFSIDVANSRVSLNLSEVHEFWEYRGHTITSTGAYQIKDVPVLITPINDNFIVVRYTGSTGRPQDFDFVSVNEPLEDVIAAERERRVAEYEKLYDAAINYTSLNYGTLDFNDDYTFSWRGYNLLVPSLIPSRAGSTGTISMNYVLSKQLAQTYDGVITFKFFNTDSELNFLYALEENGLRLEDATGAVIEGQIVTRRSGSPLVLFFEK